ncbi:MAG: zf-HC2 domain-containing protein, partial [Phycisphaerae bacterium]
MTFEQDIPDGVDERVERLISRWLDGEISPAESAELDRALAADPAARALFDDYREGDRLAAAALREDVGALRHPPSNGRFRGWRFAVAGAVLTAAAVVALSFLPVFRPIGP